MAKPNPLNIDRTNLRRSKVSELWKMQIGIPFPTWKIKKLNKNSGLARGVCSEKRQ